MNCQSKKESNEGREKSGKEEERETEEYDKDDGRVCSGSDHGR